MPRRIPLFNVVQLLFLVDVDQHVAVHSIEELIKFNEAHRDNVLPYFGQEHLEKTLTMGPLTSKKYLAALEKNYRFAYDEGLAVTIKKHRLDAVIVPSGAPAWIIDLVLGDAFCGFNPIYGQGMSVAAMSAVALANQIRESHGNLDGVAQSTLREIGKITDAIWLLATSADLEWPGTEGGTVGNSPIDRFVRWYIGEMLEAMEFDRAVRLAFIGVNQLVLPGKALFAPDMFLRVMKQVLLKRFRPRLNMSSS